ncbi:MAG: hypothetical protein ACT4OZ_14865 [Gemmatimonadota bacterium]
MWSTSDRAGTFGGSSSPCSARRWTFIAWSFISATAPISGIDIRQTIPAGDETRAIDPDGSDRVIRSIDFWYDANTLRGRDAQVRVFGFR